MWFESKLMSNIQKWYSTLVIDLWQIEFYSFDIFIKCLSHREGKMNELLFCQNTAGFNDDNTEPINVNIRQSIGSRWCQRHLILGLGEGFVDWIKGHTSASNQINITRKYCAETVYNRWNNLLFSTRDDQSTFFIIFVWSPTVVKHEDCHQEWWYYQPSVCKESNTRSPLTI